MLRAGLLSSALALAASGAQAQTAASPIIVTVTNKGCEPNELTVQAGTVTFQIVNKGSRALEWEILKGVMVVDERENIAPGFRQKLTTRLDPGDYEITCGLLSNPRGKLTVRGGEGGIVASKPTPMELVGPVAEYRVWLADELTALQAKVDALAAAGSDRQAARAAWVEAHGAYLQLAPIFPLLADVEKPASASFDRVGAVLFAEDAKDADLAGFTKDIAAFQQRARALTPAPDKLLAGAANASQALVALLGASDASAHALPDAEARLKGIARIVELFGPLATRADKAASERIAATLASTQAALRTRSGQPSLTGEEKAKLAADTSPLPGEVTALSAVLGL